MNNSKTKMVIEYLCAISYFEVILITVYGQQSVFGFSMSAFSSKAENYNVYYWHPMQSRRTTTVHSTCISTGWTMNICAVCYKIHIRREQCPTNITKHIHLNLGIIKMHIGSNKTKKHTEYSMLINVLLEIITWELTV